MFNEKEQELLVSIEDEIELIPERLRNHSLVLIAQVLENGRSQRFFNSDPFAPSEVNHEELVNAVRELRWEGFVDIDQEDVDGDGIKDDVLKTGWKTNDSGIEFLRRLKAAAGIS
jgi:hypothetical protein